MTNSSIVAALMLHNESCSPCRMGEPCVVTERILDEWLHRQALAPAETPAWPTEDAA
ncbi:hypothetical protein [Dyella nitratireducens]|uniref:NADH-quinone oxidoreductase subunit F n=1 Tax=Dyella nitratireducens TaxID=1849580 RepID=A0ABQ1FP89_9GAMM|nr:hypothetical protein [Dyella nitratireducens]GGA24771.1 hypothetical protein GCM10010981_11580 [Dyella nitratireducens]GLQ43780.1 hypothetical protein GCM10007902_36300 [Dyella nitratireducens]